jgi:hypothetical protein
MYSSSTLPKTLMKYTEVFKNEDEVYCPITSTVIKSRGCLIDYSGDVISINKGKKEIQAAMNGIDKTQDFFCIEIRNKDQVLKLDGFVYTQYPSCSQFISID